jgi:hypothetical protein
MLDNVIHIVNNPMWTLPALLFPRRLSGGAPDGTGEAESDGATRKLIAHNYCFFYGMNPIVIENKEVAKKRTQSNPIDIRRCREFCNRARLQPCRRLAQKGLGFSPCNAQGLERRG